MAHEITSEPSFGERHHFLIRRLHSLSGIVPVGVFLVMHLTVNASINGGGAEFQTNVDRIHGLGKLLVPVEIIGIFLPILFHGVVGVQIWLSGRPNTSAYKYGGNWRYLLQRVTGIIAFIFIFYHVWHMHWLGGPLGGAKFDPHDAAATAATAMRETVFGGFPVSILYAIGVLSAVYHLANGIWTSLITWGVTIGPTSQRRAGYACAAFGVVLGAVGMSSVAGFRGYQNEPLTVQSDGAPGGHADVLANQEKHPG